MSTPLFRWRFLAYKPGDKSVTVGKSTISLDAEGLAVESNFPADTEARMRSSRHWDYVAMNSDALWGKRIADSQARIEQAKAEKFKAEKAAIGAADLLRVCEDQHAQLLAERDRYSAAIGGVEAPEPEPEKPEPEPKNKSRK